MEKEVIIFTHYNTVKTMIQRDDSFGLIKEEYTNDFFDRLENYIMDIESEIELVKDEESNKIMIHDKNDESEIVLNEKLLNYSVIYEKLKELIIASKRKRRFLEIENNNGFRNVEEANFYYCFLKERERYIDSDKLDIYHSKMISTRDFIIENANKNSILYKKYNNLRIEDCKNEIKSLKKEIKDKALLNILITVCLLPLIIIPLWVIFGVSAVLGISDVLGYVLVGTLGLVFDGLYLLVAGLILSSINEKKLDINIIDNIRKINELQNIIDNSLSKDIVKIEAKKEEVVNKVEEDKEEIEEEVFCDKKTEEIIRCLRFALNESQAFIELDKQVVANKITEIIADYKKMLKKNNEVNEKNDIDLVLGNEIDDILKEASLLEKFVKDKKIQKHQEDILEDEIEEIESLLSSFKRSEVAKLELKK